MTTQTTHLKIAHVYANFMDNRYSFMGVKFGVASIIDFIPGIGDILDAILALYLVWIGVQLQLPSEKIGKMLRNIFVAFFIGLFPVIGDLGYLFYKPNMRNLKILEQYAAKVQEGHIISPQNA